MVYFCITRQKFRGSGIAAEVADDEADHAGGDEYGDTADGVEGVTEQVGFEVLKREIHGKDIAEVDDDSN